MYNTIILKKAKADTQETNGRNLKKAIQFGDAMKIRKN